MLLDLPFSAPFPIYCVFEQPVFMEFSFRPYSDVARIELQDFSLFWSNPKTTVGTGSGFGTVTVLDLTGLQQGIQLYRTSPVQTRIQFCGGLGNKISSALSQIVINVNIGPAGKSNLSYYLTSTTADSAQHVTLDLPLFMQANLTIRLG